MGRNVVVTYKRKRLFSRSDHSHINLLSDTPSESAKSKISNNFSKHEGSITERTLLNNDTVRFVNSFLVCLFNNISEIVVLNRFCLFM